MTHEQPLDDVMARYCAIDKTPHDAFTKDFLRHCQSFSVKAGGGVYKYYRRGSGPTVVLVHGIHAHLGSFVPMAEDLLAQGFKVVLFDIPAHGEASGTSTDPVQVRAFLRGILRQVGDVHAVVGHSLGGLWALSALHREFRARTVVSIAAPSTTRFLLDKFVQLNRLDAAQTSALRLALERRFGEELWTEYSPAEIVKDIDMPGLIIHGTNDDFVPPAHAQDLARQWAGARVEMVDGAAHFEMPALASVRKSVTEHLKQACATAAA